MKSLLRSLFVGDDNDNETLLLNNYQLFNSSGLGFDVPEYNAIWGFIQEFVRTHSHVPNILTIRSHFEHGKEDTVLDQLRVLGGLKTRTKGDFQGVLEDKANDRRQRLWSEALKEASIITSTGMEVQEGKGKKVLIGPVQSARYLMEKAHDVVAPTIGGRLSGEVTKDGVATREEYERVEADPLAGIGQFSFLKQMDDALGGAKRHELWIHAAFTGGLKSTLLLNWAYNQAVIYQHNSLIFSLEMPYSQCRRILYAIHSMHPKFREIRMQLGLQRDLESDVGLPYGDIRDGKLDEFHPNAKHFYFDFVIPDLGGKDVVRHPYLGCDYGKIHIEVADPDKNDFTMNDLRSMAEIIYSKEPFSMVGVDHVGLMSPRRHHQSTTENLNEVIRDLKKLALGFNRGMGIAVLGLFQISREGYKSALKAKEKTGKAGYNLTHLSYANECLPSTCIIASSRGLIQMDAVRVGDHVWSGSGWKEVWDVFDQGVKRLWKVTTNRGMALNATASHRIRVLKDGVLSWVSLQDIQVGDCMVSTCGDYPWATTTPDLPLMGGKPMTMTTDLAYLLGSWDVTGEFIPWGDNPDGPRWFRSLVDDKAVPNTILQSPRLMVVAYLYGLFSRIGWLDDQNVVHLGGQSETLIRQVQQIMTMLGYDTYLVPRSPMGPWGIQLRSHRSRMQFISEIGFTDRDRNQRLSHSLGGVLGSDPLGTLLASTVVSVEDTEREEQVWDIEVGGDHEYQTGLFLSHNCERSADVVTSTWIDDELRQQSRVQFNCMKSRDQAPFDPFIARVEWPCRRLLSCFEVTRTPEENAKMGAEIDKAAKELDDD